MKRSLNKFIYKTEKEIDTEQLVGLFNSVNWKISRFPQKLHNAIKNSAYVLSVWEDIHLVGILTAAQDRAESSKKADAFGVNLVVEPNYQGIGIGKKLISDFLTASNGTIKKLLTTEKDLEGYYAKFGFISGCTAMFKEEDWRWGTQNA
ncbi:MAG: GNAT family N-acetyltransferase [Christensenellaceae bacterium]|jgi:GNAT superfamily N-acetyltransferase|nr:GNAT family N-acetyltransferase [Christensenellaceae bacterium]